MIPDHISDADVLLVRSVTRVDEDLLTGSNVQFVGTATSGHDHIDIDFLDKKQIRFVHAPGCNARSVAEYVLSSLCVLADMRDISLHGRTAGIIGCGHVGSTVASMLSELGIECLLYDPPLQNQCSSYNFSTIEDLQSADIITLHVPLVRDGEYPTYHMIDSSFLRKLKHDVILINTSRGSVIDEHALMKFITRNPHSDLVLDVWENEPDINLNILDKTVISTPHIAGYSLDGRLNGTQMIYKKYCEFYDKKYDGPLAAHLPRRLKNRIPIKDCYDDLEAIQMAVLASYDVRSDSTGLRQLLVGEQKITGNSFTDLRNNYPIRREFSAMTVEIHNNSENLKEKLIRLGFSVEQ